MRNYKLFINNYKKDNESYVLHVATYENVENIQI